MADMKVPALAGLKSVPPLTNPIVISDVHLAPNRPALMTAFLKFLERIAPRYAELVVTGDLFDYWLGDDAMLGPDASADVDAIVSSLKLYTSNGHRTLIMPGLHDCLLGRDFTDACGAELVADPIVINVMGNSVLFSHGAQWCTKDEALQAYRAVVTSPQWQSSVMRLPAGERAKMFDEAWKAASESHPEEISEKDRDVVESAAAESARAAGAQIVIHGHTHRPGAHVNAMIERWTVPDWNIDPEKKHNKSGWVTFLEGGHPQIQLF
jgi:UDP-2,3-diacylglucosamine hydrolase